MNDPVRAYIGLGSNQQDPRHQVESALQALQDLSVDGWLLQSSLYSNPPMGPANQPDYINAAAAIHTTRSPQALLRDLQAIETRQGRVREAQRWGPRTLDLDLLLYGELRLFQADLEIPHPGLHERAFVLYPLAEIAPDLVVPGLGAVQLLLEQCPAKALERLI